MWDIPQQTLVHTLAHEGPVSCMQLNHDTGFLVSGSDDSYVRYWDIPQFYFFIYIYFLVPFYFFMLFNVKLFILCQLVGHWQILRNNIKKILWIGQK